MTDADANNAVATIVQLQAEVTLLPELNDAQNTEIARMQNHIETNSLESESQLAQALIDGLKVLNVDAKSPKFEETKNTNDFLEKLEKFYVLKSTQENN